MIAVVGRHKAGDVIAVAYATRGEEPASERGDDRVRLRRALDRVGNDHLDRVLGAAARMNSMIDALLTLAFYLGLSLIAVGMWLGLIMGFNVWAIIWPNQKKVLGFIYAPLDERVRLELDYIERYSIWYDAYLIFKTLPVVLRGQGAY